MSDAPLGPEDIESEDEAQASLERLRAICLALPEVTERISHGSPTWFIRGKKTFVTVALHGHHNNDFPHLWCAAFPGAQEELIEADPGVFFRPPYVGHRGWIGIRLDRDLEWEQIAELCVEAYRVVAPVTLVRQLDARDAAERAEREH